MFRGRRTTPSDALTVAGDLARREGQILTADRLTMDALRGHLSAHDLALDIRRALDLPMPAPDEQDDDALPQRRRS